MRPSARSSTATPGRRAGGAPGVVPGGRGGRRAHRVRAGRTEAGDRTGVPGVATGLAVTGAGGDVLFVEAGSMPAENGGGLTLTGQLGDVMKESAQIALSYVRSHADALSAPIEFDRKRIHINVTAGAVPKDGPSSGDYLVAQGLKLVARSP